MDEARAGAPAEAKPAGPDSPGADPDTELIRLEEDGHYADALALCERLLAERRIDPHDPEAERAETQLEQRRLRLRRKLRLPTWSSQGTPF